MHLPTLPEILLPDDDERALAVGRDVDADDDAVLVIACQAHVLGKPGMAVIEGAIEVEAESVLPLVDPGGVDAAVGIGRERGDEGRRLRVDAALGLPGRAAIGGAAEQDELVAGGLPSRLPRHVKLVRRRSRTQIRNDRDRVAHGLRRQVLLTAETGAGARRAPIDHGTEALLLSHVHGHDAVPVQRRGRRVVREREDAERTDVGVHAFDRPELHLVAGPMAAEGEGEPEQREERRESRSRAHHGPLS